MNKKNINSNEVIEKLKRINSSKKPFCAYRTGKNRNLRSTSSIIGKCWINFLRHLKWN